MIFVIIACAIAWKYVDGNPVQKTLRIALVGFVVAGISTVLAASLPITEITLGSDQELRVMPPTAFPLTTQQYRDYDTSQFYYRIVIGWPNGVPIFKSVTMDDQSEFIHLAHLNTGILLGEYMMAGLVGILAIIYLFEVRRIKSGSKKPETIN